ncbi:hypothetical protein HOLleu_09603 [Holothuria leucospilota]|uniref:Reverse transcriptase RNase H-like domain-containing protein n=1 Tax=Holothuria leucospilota TaxID=206669 RepID=A0A9Q1CD56_HOLLE|nr:hypothetical protein HOLleu_09603 [Holothuria leucospilota]
MRIGVLTYLESTHSTVFTDHQALVWMLHTKSLKGRLIRWALHLQEFDYDIHYRPGVQNTIPDTLSRSPQIAAIEYDDNVCFHPSCRGDPSSRINWVQCDNCDNRFHCLCLGLTKKEADELDVCEQCSATARGTCVVNDKEPSSSKIDNESNVLPDINQFIVAQKKDKNLLQIISKLESTDQGSSSIHLKYVMEGGLLKRTDNVNKKDKIGKVVVPQNLVHEVITHFHCTPTCPHLGTRKTVSKICEKFWWDKVRREVEVFIKRCT